MPASRALDAFDQGASLMTFVGPGGVLLGIVSGWRERLGADHLPGNPALRIR